MKNRVWNVIIIISLFLFIGITCACSETNLVEKRSRLPLSLGIIDEEAFEGTALTNVELSTKTIEIGDRAFANNSYLKQVCFSSSVKYISKDVFEGSDQTTLVVPAESYAYEWAREGRNRFMVSPILKRKAEKPNIAVQFGRERQRTKVRLNGFDKTILEYSKRKQTGRTLGEIKMIKGRKVFSMYVRSRFFP